MKSNSRNNRRKDGTKRDGTDGARQSINHTRNARCRLKASQVVFFVILCIFGGKGRRANRRRTMKVRETRDRAYVITSANKNNIENGIV